MLFFFLCEITDSPKGWATPGARRQNSTSYPLLRCNNPHTLPSDCGISVKYVDDRVQSSLPCPGPVRWNQRERHRWGVSLALTCFPLRRFRTVSLHSPMLVEEKLTESQAPHFHWHLKVKPPCIVHNDISHPHVWKGWLWELLEGGGNLSKFTGAKGLDLMPFLREHLS